MAKREPPHASWWPRPPSLSEEWELTSHLVSRPLAAALLYPVRHVAPPNLVTLLSLFTGCLGALFLLATVNPWFPDLRIAGLALLFLSMVLDDGDGQLARFQKRTGVIGSFLDKTVDVIRFGLLFPVLGVLAYEQTGNWLHAFAGPFAAFGLMIQGYSKWLFIAHFPDQKADSSSHRDGKVPGGLIKAIVWPFNECDLTTWIVILGLLQWWVPLVWIMAASQMIAGITSLVARMFFLFRADRSA